MQNYGYSYDNILRIVNESMGKNRLFHACIIHGNHGTRKTHLSSEIAKQILNYNHNNKEISKNFHLQSPDLHIVSNDTSIISVDDVRDIKNWIKHTTINSKYKVVVVDDIDRMNKNASNAFLKILEEPIGNAIFILNTSYIRSISDTLSSRCIKMRLNKINLEDFTNILGKLCCSKIKVIFDTIYELCHGDINLAIMLIEQNHLNTLIKFYEDKVYDKAIEVISALNLESNIDLRIFKCFATIIASKLIRTNFSEYALPQKNDDLFINLEKVQYVIANLENLNKKYSQQIIINTLKKCF